MTRSETGCAESTIAALVQTSTPINRFPDVVRYAAGTDQALLPDARQAEDRRETGPGRHAHRQDDRRTDLKEAARRAPASDPRNVEQQVPCLEISGHTWNADLTAVPISGGFWTPWIPTAIAQHWPVCWWVLSVIDIDWYNEHRPHKTLDGKTPNEVHYGARPPTNSRVSSHAHDGHAVHRARRQLWALKVLQHRLVFMALLAKFSAAQVVQLWYPEAQPIQRLLRRRDSPGNVSSSPTPFLHRIQPKRLCRSTP